jgi:hypothetical protein
MGGVPGPLPAAKEIRAGQALGHELVDDVLLDGSPSAAQVIEPLVIDVHTTALPITAWGRRLCGQRCRLRRGPGYGQSKRPG